MKTAKKIATKKPTKKPAVNAPLPEGMIGTAEAAALCKVSPRLLRIVLRDTGKGTGGKRYAWKENDPCQAARADRRAQAARGRKEKVSLILLSARQRPCAGCLVDGSKSQKLRAFRHLWS